MSVTNLTGTTWKFKSNLSFSGLSNPSFRLNFTSNATSTTLYGLLSVNTTDSIIKYIYKGDINQNGVVDNEDKTTIALYLNGTIQSLTPVQEAIADFNCDGQVNNADRLMIARAIEGEYGAQYTTDAGNIYDISGESFWASEDYKTISITGGADVENSTLITWLEANATLIANFEKSDTVKVHKVPTFSFWKQNYGVENGIGVNDLVTIDPNQLEYAWQNSGEAYSSRVYKVGITDDCDITPTVLNEINYIVLNEEHNHSTILIAYSSNLTIILPKGFPQDSENFGYEVRIINEGSGTITIQAQDDTETAPTQLDTLFHHGEVQGTMPVGSQTLTFDDTPYYRIDIKQVDYLPFGFEGAPYDYKAYWYVEKNGAEGSGSSSINVNGILKGNGSGTITAAVAGTDYVTPDQVPSASNDNPLGIGTRSAGVSTSFSRADHIHPPSSWQNVTSSRSLAESDNGKTIACYTNDVTITIPEYATGTTVFSAGFEVEILNWGNKTVTITPATNVLLNGDSSSIKLDKRYGSVRLKCVNNSSKSWVVILPLMATAFEVEILYDSNATYKYSFSKTFAEIKAAVEMGRPIKCKYSNQYCQLAQLRPGYLEFKTFFEDSGGTALANQNYMWRAFLNFDDEVEIIKDQIAISSRTIVQDYPT